MKKIILMMSFICCGLSNSYTMVIKDPTIIPPTEGSTPKIADTLPTYNPYSLYVPSKEFLQTLPSEIVLDMGASAYAANFLMKSLYFYTNAMDIFEEDPNVHFWAAYEAGFIYFRWRSNEKALIYFDLITQSRNAPTATKKLATVMSARIRNSKEYKILLKQEDVVFLADKKARSILDKQIAKEERAAERAQRALAKERKKREKEEQRLLKEQEKLEKQKAKEQETQKEQEIK